VNPESIDIHIDIPVSAPAGSVVVKRLYRPMGWRSVRLVFWPTERRRPLTEYRRGAWARPLVHEGRGVIWGGETGLDVDVALPWPVSFGR